MHVGALFQMDQYSACLLHHFVAQKSVFLEKNKFDFPDHAFGDIPNGYSIDAIIQRCFWAFAPFSQPNSKPILAFLYDWPQ